MGGLRYCRYGLATAVIIAATTATATIVVKSTAVTATAAAEEDDDEDYNPRTVITTKVTHLRKPPFLFSSHTMQNPERVLQKVIIFLCVPVANLMLLIAGVETTENIQI